MKKQFKYSLGDVFEISLDDYGKKGYGRILIIEKPSIFIELYKLKPTTQTLEMKEIKQLEPLFSVWSVDNAIKGGEWNIIGNMQVDGEVKIPDFWTKDVFTDKIVLIRGDRRIEITEEQIGNHEQFGIYGDGAVRLSYIRQLMLSGIDLYAE